MKELKVYLIKYNTKHKNIFYKNFKNEYKFSGTLINEKLNNLKIYFEFYEYKIKLNYY